MPEFLFPMIRYHTRWGELKAEDFAYLFGKRQSSNKGYFGTDKVEPHTAPVANVTQEILLPQRTEELLGEMAEMASERGISLLFMNFPYSHLSDDDMNMYHAIEKYMRQRCGELGVNFEYIDYNQRLDEIGFDYNTDCQDFSHLNDSGAQKVSEALAGYISEHYSFDR